MGGSGWGLRTPTTVPEPPGLAKRLHTRCGYCNASGRGGLEREWEQNRDTQGGNRGCHASPVILDAACRAVRLCPEDAGVQKEWVPMPDVTGYSTCVSMAALQGTPLQDHFSTATPPIHKKLVFSDIVGLSLAAKINLYCNKHSL